MKTLFTKLIYMTLIAASLAGGVTTALANHDSSKKNQWHMDEPDRSRFEAIQSGNDSAGSF